jgi:thioredoxin-like negative regulator of GroEL
MSDTRVYWPDRDQESIRAQLQQGQRLIACLCAGWCSSCQSWLTDFSNLCKDFSDDCFVWVDIEDHPDLVAEIDLETLPILLIQDADSVHFLGPIQPRVELVARMLMRTEPSGNFPDPGLRDLLS